MTKGILLAADAFDPGSDGLTLLNILSWCATAAGVLGLIIVGIYLTLKLLSGVPGETEMYLKQFTFVIMASVLAASAGPLVSFLSFF